MTRVTILGAGDMGTALTTPAAANGHDVRLWGTELDGAIVAALRDGAPHPRLKVAAPATVRVFGVEAAAAALDGAEIAVVAVTSSAVRKIVGRLAPLIAPVRAVMTVAKGFDDDSDGRVRILPEVIAEFYGGPVIAVGGPSKANEVALGLPTGVVFAGEETATVTLCREAFATPVYHVEPSDDVAGVEVAAAMKNAYAIALGVADGLQRRTERPYHNLKAALFPLAVREMGLLAALMGGRRETVEGLAGAGDLQVTITSGRNRLLGERIGCGDEPASVVRQLEAGGTTLEGYAAADFGYRLAQRFIAAGATSPTSFPLLTALWRVLYGRAPALETLWAALRV